MTIFNDFAFVVAPDRHLAYRIFNTFNTRGLKLNQADLIKSHLLSKTTDDPGLKKSVQAEWPKIFNEDLDDHDKFLYESISSRNPSGSINHLKITQDNLYRIIDKEIKSTKDIKMWLDNFKHDAAFLKIMDHPEDLPPEQRYDRIRSDFYGIQTLKARYIRVPILTAYRIWKDVTKKEFQELVECLLIFFFRFKFINDGTAEDVRSIANKVTRDLEAGKPISNIVYHILVNEDVPGRPTKRISDENFKDTFKKKMYKTQKSVAKYVLASIEMTLRRNEGKEKAYIEYNFEVEHILPRNHGKYWQGEKFLDNEESDDGISKYKDRIGNLTILSSKWNRGLGAKKFQDKRDHKKGYANSDFMINQYLKKCKDWTATEVSNREDSLGDIAEDAWSLDRYDKYLKKEGWEE